MKSFLFKVFAVLVWIAGIYVVFLLPTQHLASVPGADIIATAFPMPGQESVMSKPTISASAINRVLALHHSPAAGTGVALFSYGVQYGIDPAYALAFFHHESRYGTTGVARFTHSLGNIRCSAGYQCLQGFRAYVSWQAGYLDWYRLIRDTYVARWGLTTPATILPVYAPESRHNDVQAYIDAVASDVSRWRAGDIS
jgi:hypothetical protein